MAKRLTNAQMDILAERVTDLLEEANNEKQRQLKDNPKYKNYLAYIANSDTIYKEGSRLRHEAEELDTQQQLLAKRLEVYAEKYKDEVGSTPYWGSTKDKIQKLLDGYVDRKREEEFPVSVFNRDKILRKVKADILLSDVDNNDELVKTLVAKML